MFCSIFDECTIKYNSKSYKSRLMQFNNKIFYWLLAAVVVSMTFTASGIRTALAQNPIIPSANQGANSTNSTMSNMSMNMSAPAMSNKTTITRDSETILLEGKTLPANDFIHLYDSTPYMIMNGHIAMKLPCDTSSVSPVKVLIGSAPNFTAVQPGLVKELSKPGDMCLYHVDVGSDLAKKVIQTDIAIKNPTNTTITFPPTSTVTIGINEIMPGAPG